MYSGILMPFELSCCCGGEGIDPGTPTFNIHVDVRPFSVVIFLTPFEVSIRVKMWFAFLIFMGFHPLKWGGGSRCWLRARIVSLVAVQTTSCGFLQYCYLAYLVCLAGARLWSRLFLPVWVGATNIVGQSAGRNGIGT